MSGTQQSACGTGGAACKVCSGSDKCVGGKCTATCDPTTCVGCCAGTTCKGGSDPSACGKNGAACATCKTGEQCVNGTCNSAATCSPTNCAGCCASGVCQAGTTDSQCGKGGAVCGYCKWYENCTSQTCTFDPTAKWFVDLVEVKLVTTKAWDVWSDDPKPDVYVVASSGTATHTTKTIDNNYSPVFNEYLFYVAAQDLMNELKFKIYDDDMAFDDLICDHTDFVLQSEILNGELNITWACYQYVVSVKFKFY
jgi:hypothetical protein